MSKTKPVWIDSLATAWWTAFWLCAFPALAVIGAWCGESDYSDGCDNCGGCNRYCGDDYHNPVRGSVDAFGPN
jgi:hypothetical protein